MVEMLEGVWVVLWAAWKDTTRADYWVALTVAM
jgi:hypothetical protein